MGSMEKSQSTGKVSMYTINCMQELYGANIGLIFLLEVINVRARVNFVREI